MTVYIDSDYRCHTAPAAGLTAFDTGFFDGKCPEFIAGCRAIPPGSTWTRADGVRFHGEAYSLAVDYAPLAAAQRAYEQTLLAESPTAEEIAAAIEEGVNSI